MKFEIEQIAICPNDPRAARALLKALGLELWVDDTVEAHGMVHGAGPYTNVAELSFNYQASPPQPQPLELEILAYQFGRNWMDAHPASVSHLGMHCSAEQLALWREKFAALDIQVAQEVVTSSHTNPAIKGRRRYNYVIFDTRSILGVDLKFIVRLPDATGAEP